MLEISVAYDMSLLLSTPSRVDVILSSQSCLGIHIFCALLVGDAFYLYSCMYIQFDL